MAKKRGSPVAFGETEIGSSIIAFIEKWHATKFHQDYPHIDLKALWYSLDSYSANGGRYIDWIAAGRQFYLRSPKQYFKVNGTKPADQQLVDAAKVNLDTAKRNTDRIFGRDRDNDVGGHQE